MNPILILLMLPVIIIPIVMKYMFDRDISFGEMAAQFGAGIAVVGLVYALSIQSATSDTEYLNGSVISKDQVSVPCSHSYDCHCHTDRKGNRHCDTCYEHSNDYEWRVFSTAGNFDVDRIDRRGSYEPPRWTKVRLNEPVTRPHGYTNYVKAVPDSLFAEKPVGDIKTVPGYPEHYDYQYVDRVIAPDMKIADLAQWNEHMSWVNSRLGPTKQADVILIITSNPSPNYSYLVQQAWIGAKKNDVVIVVGAPQYPQIAWVRAFSWAQHDIVNVRLREEVMNLRTLDFRTTLPAIEKVVKESYDRKPMKDYEYLYAEIEPPTWLIVLMLIVGSGLSIGIGLYCRDN